MNNTTRVLAIAFIICAAVFFLAMPIHNGDTDMWYHLNGGRYFHDTGKIPSSSFFSFIQPARQWNNYYWLFQIVTFNVFRAGGYYGLILLRALVYIGTILLFFIFFCSDKEARLRFHPFFIFIAACFSLAIIGRFQLVRPHMYSYFFLTAFIVLLEDNRKPIWLLPVIAILWSNLHGIVYPVWLLVLGAYLMEDAIYHIRHIKEDELVKSRISDGFEKSSSFKARESRGMRRTCQYVGMTGDEAQRRKWTFYGTVKEADTGKKRRLFMVIAILCVLATPHGIRLLNVPFDAPPFQPMYINELKKLQIADLFHFDFSAPFQAFASIQKVILILSAVCVLVLAAARRMRISHLMMSVGATYLLTRHMRFTYDAILLFMPAFRQGVRLIATRSDGFFFKRFALVLALISVMLPILVFGHILLNSRPKYPFSCAGLPCGIVTFLNRIDADGKILNDPNSGGYVEWALSPRYKIFMDLQMSIFRDEDFYFARNAPYERDILGRFIETYDPSFLMISFQNTRFESKTIKKFKQFVPVAVDDAEVLYVNRLHHPDIAAQYAMKHLNPFKMADLEYETLDGGELESVREELLRLAETSAQSLIINKALCNLFTFKGYFPKAELYAKRILEEYPEKPDGYARMAHVLIAQKNYREAARFSRLALKKEGKFPERDTYMNLFTCLMRMNDVETAHNVLFKYVNPFDWRTEADDIHAMYKSARANGKMEQARMLRRIHSLLTGNK